MNASLLQRPATLLLLAGAVLSAFFLLGPALTIGLHVPLNYNEGWNAYLDRRAIVPGAGPLYPPPGSLAFNNYPPLSFVLVGAFGWLVGDMIVAGRVVALASLLACSVLVCSCVRRLGGTRAGGVAAALLLLLYSSTFFHGYVAMDDPQWLAHALMLGGLAMLLGGRVVPAALLMVAGGFVKHSLVGLPVAVTVWLAMERRHAVLVWLGACAGAVGLGLAAAALVWGQAAFADVLGHHRVFSIGRWRKAVERLAPMLPMLLVAVGAARARPDRPMRLALLFVAISLVAGIGERLGEGIYYNAHFETLIGLCLVTGLVMSRATRPALLLGFASLPVLLMLPWLAAREWRDIADREARARAWRPVIARIASAPGLAGCETLSLCYWAGKPFAVDLFNLEERVRAGGSMGRFEALARAHAFGVFEYAGDFLPGDDPVAARGRDPLLRTLLEAGYRRTGSGPAAAMLLVPVE